MTIPAIADAVALIRAGQTEKALNLLEAAIPDLPPEARQEARKYAGLACYFAERWPEALAYFTAVAEESAIPEDHFNVAMSLVKLGEIEPAHTAWERVFTLSYEHQDAPESSSFFEKKLLFARALLDARAPDPRGLDLVGRQLMGFYTTNHITDPGFWGMRRVPDFESVLAATREFYRGMGKPEAEWGAYLDGIVGQLDEEGRALAEGMRGYT